MLYGHRHLVILTIMERPADYPSDFVVVADAIVPGETDPLRIGCPWLFKTLEQARVYISGIEPGMIRLEKDPSDLPCIVECWV